MIIARKEKLEEVGGFDESLAYGEDADLHHRMNLLEGDTYIIKDATEYHTLVSSLGEVYRQGKWYGKSMPAYFKKYPSQVTSLLSIPFFVLLPLITIAAFFHSYILYLAVSQHLLVFLYVIEGLRRTRNPYTVFVPLIKIVRSYAEIVGMFEGLFTEDLGRE